MNHDGRNVDLMAYASVGAAYVHSLLFGKRGEIF